MKAADTEVNDIGREVLRLILGNGDSITQGRQGRTIEFDHRESSEEPDIRKTKSVFRATAAIRPGRRTDQRARSVLKESGPEAQSVPEPVIAAR
ncbi:hypothetical protein GCM10008957_28380 [Deinococcus ruber]|uniref:Uncharacterized protein n=1 Tax=Deinococcus ruber TaxID=1848197 RepID=A0A918CBH6_9DEIO|nr:hypothetical protein GCM10008957_28380 [Deinococcus ruber]